MCFACCVVDDVLLLEFRHREAPHHHRKNKAQAKLSLIGFGQCRDSRGNDSCIKRTEGQILSSGPINFKDSHFVGFVIHL